MISAYESSTSKAGITALLQQDFNLNEKNASIQENSIYTEEIKQGLYLISGLI